MLFGNQQCDGWMRDKGVEWIEMEHAEIDTQTTCLVLSLGILHLQFPLLLLTFL